jgi:hypothetical protein
MCCVRGKKVILPLQPPLDEIAEIYFKKIILARSVFFNSEGTSGATVTTKLAISLSVRVHKRNKPRFL